MRVAKFCEKNLKSTTAGQAIDILQRNYSEDVQVHVVDCFKRCLECRMKPFSRIQLTTVEAADANTLVENILKLVRQETR